MFSVLFDARDPGASARWWSEALGRTLAYENDEGSVVAPGPFADSIFVFLPVPEAKTVKNRIHLDLASESDDHQHKLVDRLVGLGARPVDIGQRDVPWVVLADPDGNEFCVLEPRGGRYRDTGPIAAVVVDAADPLALTRFWTDATGWPVVEEEEWGTALRGSSDGAFLEFIRNDEPKVVKNRVHFDLRPAPGGEQAAEVDRLVGLGARHVDIGQSDVPWVVLADPEGNEFCVLTPP